MAGDSAADSVAIPTACGSSGRANPGLSQNLQATAAAPSRHRTGTARDSESDSDAAPGVAAVTVGSRWGFTDRKHTADRKTGPGTIPVD